MSRTGQLLPLWLKIAFSAWIAVWAPAYVVIYGPQNFFWLCNVASFLILLALWLEHRLLFSAQLLSVLLVGTLWTFDVGVALLTGVHPIGGTQYMFDDDVALPSRLLSLYHVVLPVVAVYACLRLGYDRRALLLQTLLTWIVVPLSWVFTDPERNINWVEGPFGEAQDVLDPRLYVALLTLAWPVIIYVPVHLTIRALQYRR